MNLAEIELTPAQADALLDLLNERVKLMERKAAQAEEETAIALRLDAWHERLAGLATRTARIHGKLVGVDTLLQAEAAWNTFIVNESWFSTFDVDEHWSERSGFDWQETWTHAYCAEVERMIREKVVPCLPEAV